jgi:CubicO group peptidase (beta-lactamase class C family)
MHMKPPIAALVFLIAAISNPVSAQRQWTVTGLEVPELSAVDAMVRGQMMAYGIRGASVAVAKDGRLVYARGFTWDQPEVEPIQPTTLFRTASIGKSITSIAIHKLIEDDLLSYETRLTDILDLQPPPGRASDPWLDRVTVDHLLTHTVGWDSDLPGGLDPLVYRDDFVSASLGVNAPPTRHEIASLMAGWPLQFFPGSRWGYCNVGYLLLGMIAEEVTGHDFPEFVFDQVFRPVGVERARMARTLRSDLAPTETTYDGVEGDAYGLTAENAFAAGGMAMAASDLARVYSSVFDAPDGAGLLEASTIDDMLTVPFPAAQSIGYGRGWKHEDFFSNSGHTVGWLTDPNDDLRVFGHGGGGGGAHTVAIWRSDGVVMVWFTNKDPVIPTIDFPEISTWPGHDLWESVGISSGPIGSAPTESWIQAAAHTDGLGGSVWRTEVGLLNRSLLRNRVRLSYHHTEGRVDRELELGPGQMEIVEDIVGGFGLEGFGPLQVVSSNALSVTSRTFDTSDGGTYGQSFDGVTATGGLESGETAVLMQLREDAVARTNIGINNQWRRAARVEISLYADDGSLLTGHTREIPAQSTIQLDRPFLTLGGQEDVSSGYAVVTVRSGQDVSVYGSVIDNSTGDPTSIPMKIGRGHRRQLIAAAAHNPGAEGSFWRTDVCLLNRSPTDATATIEFRGSGGPGSSITVTVPGWRQIEIGDVVAAAGSNGPGGLVIGSDVPILAASRTYNSDPEGTYGLALDAIPSERALIEGETVWLPHLAQNDAFRSNIGIFNGGDHRTDIRLVLFDAEGRETATILRSLKAGGWLHLQEPFLLAGGRDDIDAGSARLEIESGSGVVAFASVIDNTTNDGTAITTRG